MIELLCMTGGLKVHGTLHSSRLLFLVHSLAQPLNRKITLNTLKLELVRGRQRYIMLFADIFERRLDPQVQGSLSRTIYPLASSSCHYNKTALSPQSTGEME